MKSTEDLISLKKLYDKKKSIKVVAKMLGMSYGNVYYGLQRYNKIYGGLKLWKTTRNLDRLKEVKEIYDKTNSLATTGKTLGVSRQRIEQLLKEYKKHFGNHSTKTEVVTQYLKKQKDYINIIKTKKYTSQKEFCEKENINVHLFNKLNIDKSMFKGNLKEIRSEQATKKYIDLSKKIGHNLTSYELQKDYPSLNGYITRYFGSYVKFRKDIGV